MPCVSLEVLTARCPLKIIQCKTGDRWLLQRWPRRHLAGSFVFFGEPPMNNLKGGRLRLPLKLGTNPKTSDLSKAPLGCSNSPRIVDPLEDCQEATDLTPTERSQPIYETCPQRKSTVSLRSWSCDFSTTTHIPEDGVPLNSTTTNFSSTTLSNLGTRLF
jgi:hypothetical protein